jgi:hypothetical protein
MACQFGHRDTVSVLLDAGADPFLPRLEVGTTPYDIAELNEHHSCVELIRAFPERKKVLQSERNQIAVKIAVNKLKNREGELDRVRSLNLNDMTEEEFVFFVLEDMKSRQMHGLADQVVSHVGVNIGREPEMMHCGLEEQVVSHGGVNSGLAPDAAVVVAPLAAAENVDDEHDEEQEQE